jgi:hypothetical protein
MRPDMSKPATPRKTKPVPASSGEFLDDCLDALDQLDELGDLDLEGILGKARRVNDGESFD